ncbi:MAG: hypothetical protein EAZ32_11530 [Cytophagia bacterium]|jgi:tetratricopeptide (TPR) repeat protein|nr:MAG: hypothetical protein EAZ38_12185 [Cytophagales bacterium]TAG38791.1 MAG: hypothetical protein EAZ32_11530 [Cytophagia bacterium]TAG51553.1 MAG: hypothetical protein EAZ29_09340 [Runella slithyformis]TAG70153.1 MAG: hypothetical protein EAZ26_06340 [Runella slithyformis]
MKASFVLFLLGVPFFEITAQTLQFASNSRTVSASSERVDSQKSIKNLHLMPLFGETAKTGDQIEREISFLNDCDQNFETRQEASKFFSDRAWEYLRDNELDTACYRFNLSWLLNPKNADAYWGLGVVCFQKGYFTDAERMLRMGIDTDSTNVGILVDLATVDLIHFKQSNEGFELTEAEQILDRALQLDTTNANTYLKRAVLEFHKGNYKKSWANLHQTRVLDMELLDLDFLKELLAKECDPEGIFSDKY